MKIFLLAPVHKEYEYIKKSSTTPFLKYQGQQSWVTAFKKLGHQVAVFRYSDSVLVPNLLRIYFKHYLPNMLYKGIYRVIKKAKINIFEDKIKNDKLYKTAIKNHSDLIIISSGVDFLDSKNLKKIKEVTRAKIALFAGVNPEYAVPKNELKMVHEGLIDVVVENDEGYAKKWKKLGAKQVVVLPISSVDPTIHKKMKLSGSEQLELGSDVCFVGTLTSKRQNILVKLTDFNLSVWGDVPAKTPLISSLMRFYKGVASGQKMVKIFNASKIVLNFQPNDMETGGNMRTFEIPGCGAFQLADKVDIRWLKDKKEVIIFKNIADLKKKIIYYLVHEEKRKKIAESGFLKVHTLHTYEKHLKKILP